MHKSGFVAISGRTNVGKSAIMNGILGQKVAIVSDKPETTRDNIKGIFTDTDCQIVFTDTPGIHKPHDLLGKIMLNRAQTSLMDSDMALFVTEPFAAFGQEDLNAMKRLPDAGSGKPVFFLLNKADRVKNKKRLLPLLEKAREAYPFKEIIPMCALEKKDIEHLISLIKQYLPEGPAFYPEDQVTDRDDTFMIAEAIREKILHLTREEVPHSSAVVVDRSEQADDGSFDIYATVYVERISQKSIIIGNQGSMIKKIKLSARREIKKMLGAPARLELWVKVSDKWKKDPSGLEEMGYSEM